MKTSLKNKAGCLDWAAGIYVPKYKSFFIDTVKVIRLETLKSTWTLSYLACKPNCTLLKVPMKKITS